MVGNSFKISSKVMKPRSLPLAKRVAFFRLASWTDFFTSLARVFLFCFSGFLIDFFFIFGFAFDFLMRFSLWCLAFLYPPPRWIAEEAILFFGFFGILE